MKNKRNIKNIFQGLVFTFLAFITIGAVNVSAETVMVNSINTFTKEFKNIDSTSDVIILAKDIDMSSIDYNQQLFIYKDKTIDLNGNILILPNYQLALVYQGNATVKFIDSSSGKTGKIIGADNSTGDYPLIKVSNTNTTDYKETYLVFNGVKIERTKGQIISTEANQKISKTSFIDCNIINFDSLVDMRATDKVYLENITFTTDNVPFQRYLINSSELTIKDVISEDCEVVKISSAGVLVEDYEGTTILENVFTYANNTTLKVRYKDGFTVSNANLKETLGYTSSTSVEIPITNRGTSNLKIENVSVNDLSKFEIIPGDNTDLEAGKIDKSWKIKARDGVSAGTYKAVITVTGSNTKTYTGEVTLEVEEYEDGYKTIYATSFDELKNAIDGVKYDSEGTIVTDTSIRKVKLGADIIIPDKKSLRFNIINDFVLDLNGYTIDGYTYDRTIILVYGNNDYQDFDSGSLTIIDSSSSQSGTINLGRGAIEIQQFNINDNNKNYKLIIDGGKYYQKYGQEHYIINFNNSDTYWKDKKISFDFKVNKGYFEFEGLRGKLLLAQSFVENEQNVNLNISFERLTLKGKNSYLLYANDKAYTLNEVLAEGSDLYVLNKDNKQKLITNKSISAITYVPGNEYATGDPDFEYGLYEGIKIAKQQGFTVTAPTFDKVEYGYSSVTPKAISITNIGESALTIANVTVSSSETEAKFAFNTGSNSTLNPNQVDASWFVYPVTGLSAGTHEAVITVTDDGGNTYTTTVTFVVEPKRLTEIGINLDSKYDYGDKIEPTFTGISELSEGDYKIEYAEFDGEKYVDLAYTPAKPRVGKYKVTIIVTNQNYTAADTSVFFEVGAKKITPSVTPILEQTYTGSQITPEVFISYTSGDVFTLGEDYTVEYGENINAGENKGKVIIKAVSGRNYTWDDLEATFNIVPKSLTDSSISVELTETSFRHTGSEIKPEPVVKDGTETLTKDIDYKLTYSNNTGVGNAEVKVTGLNNYKDYVTKTFSIVSKNVQEINFTDSIVNKTYGDTPFTITANRIVAFGNITYESNNSNVAEVDGLTGKVTIKGVGTAKIKAIISETDEYASGFATYNLNVSEKEISYSATVKNKTYDGGNNATIDTITFNDLVNGDTLLENTDYKIISSKFVSVNIGTNIDVNIKIELLNTDVTKNYTLSSTSIVATANITGKEILDGNVTIDTSTPLIYDGSEKRAVVKVKDGSTDLIENTDYRLVYSNNKNASSNAKVKVFGIGNYSGEVEKTFEISKKEVILEISEISPLTYNGQEQRPSITIKDRDNGNSLIPDEDYTLSYSNNKDAGDATITITKVNTSNYTFGSTTKTFKILKYTISLSDVSLSAERFIYDGLEHKPIVTVKVNNIEIPNTEYDVIYDSDITSEGSKNVTIKAKTTSLNYQGEVVVNYEIVSKTVLTISGIEDQIVTYTARPVELVGTLSVSNGIDASALTEKWYKDSVEIEKPTKVGIYKVIYTYEDSNYIGSKTINVEITKKESNPTTLNTYQGISGDKLSSITLPNGFKFADSNETIIAGNKEYNATYTENNDTENYTTKNVLIKVYGKSKINLTTSVNGIGGNISPSKTNVLEGTYETITFNANEGFILDKVLVNGVDKTDSITNNKLNILIENVDLNVVVTYKTIQYTITINNLENATIEPNGIIKVDYNTDKTFTILANTGYKLVSVKVNGVEKITDLVLNKLTLKNIKENMEIVVVVEKNIYEVIEGSNQEYIITKDTEARFKIDAEYSKFERGGSVYVDGNLVDPDFYDATTGSTVITLKKNFIDKLATGEHILNVKFTDGEASTKFIVTRENSEENPKTGDNLMTYIITGIISTVGILGVGAYFYKRKQH